MPLLWVESVDPAAKPVVVSLGPDRPKITAPGDDVDKAIQSLTARFGEVEKSKAVAKLILWAHRHGDFWGLPVTEDPKDPRKDLSLALEHGVRAFFEKKAYLVGEYWQFPARPGFEPITTSSSFNPPDGPEHVYAPLLAIKTNGDLIKLRHFFARLDTITE